MFEFFGSLTLKVDGIVLFMTSQKEMHFRKYHNTASIRSFMSYWGRSADAPYTLPKLENDIENARLSNKPENDQI